MLRQPSYYRQVVIKVPGVTPGGNTSPIITFGPQNDLRNARILAVTTYFASALAFAQPQSSLPVVDDSFSPFITFKFETNDPDDVKKVKGIPQTIEKGGGFSGTLDTIKWIPAADIQVINGFPTAAGVSPAPFVRNHIEWKNRYIVWETSGAWITGGGLKNTTDLAIVLGVYYTYLTEDGLEIVRS